MISSRPYLAFARPLFLAAVATVCCLMVPVLTWGAAKGETPDRAQTASSSPGSGPTANPESSLYLQVQLAGPVKVSKLKTGDTLEGRLARDVYLGDRDVFPAGSQVRAAVGNLERRRRESSGRWPGVITFFMPRHQSYPTVQSATVRPPGGGEVPIQAKLVSIGPQMLVQAKPKAANPGPVVSPAPQAVKAPNEPGSRAKPPKPGQTMILEATEFPGGTPSAPAAPPEPGELANQAQPATIDTGTRAQVILLGGLSASKSHAGESFRARLLEPVRAGSAIVLPEGILLEGKVIKATPPRWLSRPGSLKLTFTGLTLPSGTASPVAAALAGAQLDPRLRTRLDSEGGLSGGRPGKAWTMINLGAAAGIAKVSDDTFQLVIETLVSSATDASTAGTARIVAACASGIFMVTRRGRDVVLPRFTEMDITFERPLSVPGQQPSATTGTENWEASGAAPIHSKGGAAR